MRQKSKGLVLASLLLGIAMAPVHAAERQD
jgi:hypothetical protein